jgi:hypothetical protein
MKRVLAGIFAIMAALLLGNWLVVRPSTARAWVSGQQRAPRAIIAGDSLTIRDVRNFEWKPDGSATERWEDRHYDLSKLESAWFALAPFERENRGPAHTFLSFGFSDSQYVSISVEARREQGEDYALLKGLLRRYEILYVIGDERDVVGLRVQRGDDVYLYPIRTSKDKVRALFVDMLERANQLAVEPEFYNTLTNNCTTNILEHANSVSPGRIPYGKEVLLPGYADELALRLGLIDRDATIEQVRARYLINERAQRFTGDSLYPLRIREHEPAPAPPVKVDSASR